jgi:hypothetical protein
MSGTFLDTAEHDDHFPDRLTVQEYTPGTKSGRGVEAPGVWSDVAGLTDLPCLIYGSKGQEVPSVEDGADDTTISTHIIMTQNYYSAISARHRGVIDGKIYNLLLCDHEGMKTVGLITAKRIDT